MNNIRLKRSILLCAMLLTSSLVFASADEQAGYAAYQQGDYQQAFALLSDRVREPSPEVYFRLGQMYQDGLGIAQNKTMARTWYEKAAAREYSPALYNLAILYYSGDGVKQDYAQARNLAARAATLGYGKAAIWLGNMYAQGNGVAQDYRKAYIWFGTASLNGDATGSLNQFQLAQHLSPEDRSALEQQLAQYANRRSTAERQVANKVQQDTVNEPISTVASTGVAVTQFVWTDEARDTQPIDPHFLTNAQDQPTSLTPAALSSDTADQPMRQVAPGETLYGIARKISNHSQIDLNNVLAALRRTNPTLAEDRGLFTGEWLQIPAFAEPPST